jgi:hypothetical protein
MTAAALIEEVYRRGIVLTPRGDRLGFRGPVGALTPELKAALKQFKPEVLGLLAAGTTPAAAPEPWPPRPAELGGPDGIRWPDEIRERWGRRSAELEDQGVPWPEHESRAFAEVKAEFAANAGGAP